MAVAGRALIVTHVEQVNRREAPDRVFIAEIVCESSSICRNGYSRGCPTLRYTESRWSIGDDKAAREDDCEYAQRQRLADRWIDRQLMWEQCWEAAAMVKLFNAETCNADGQSN